MTSSAPTKLSPWPIHTQQEIEAVVAVLKSGKTNYWTGEVVRRFEEDYARYLGQRHAIALHNGTLALELAMVACGVGAGDEVITTARTFVASASAVVVRGATPVIADIERDSGNLSVRTVEHLITSRTRRSEEHTSELQSRGHLVCRLLL